MDVVAAAHMDLADEDLRYGPPAIGPQHHLLAQRRILHVDLFEG